MLLIVVVVSCINCLACLPSPLLSGVNSPERAMHPCAVSIPSIRGGGMGNDLNKKWDSDSDRALHYPPRRLEEEHLSKEMNVEFVWRWNFPSLPITHHYRRGAD